MLSLTKKTDYAVIAMSHLAAAEPKAIVSAREIAESFGMPLALLMNILKRLCTAGLVQSVRGARGGYRLARSPRDITLADLVVALEGPVRLAECVVADHAVHGSPVGASAPCRLGACCPIQGTLQRVQTRLQEFLESITLAEIAAGADARAGAPAV